MLLLPIFTYALLRERSLYLFEMMRIQGLPVLPYWLGNYLYSFLFGSLFSLLAFVTGIILGLRGFSFEMFLTLLLGAHSVSCLSIFLSSLFTSIATGNSFSFLVVFSSIVIPAFLASSTVASTGQVIAALIPPVGLAQALMFILTGSYSQWITSFFLCLVGSTILLLFGVYLHEIRSSPYLVAKDPLMGLFQRKKSAKIESLKQEQETDADIEEENIRATQPKSSQEAIRVVNLRKAFGQKEVVRGISLLINYGECFGLLGPNGAGKTTTLSMIIGAISPTSGQILIDGEPRTDDLWKRVGVCPQFDTVWPDLTVEEHFIFYCRLRGVTSSQIANRARNIAVAVELDGDAYRMMASQLSGGMRRRLSIGITLAANPRVLIFDEPTTGLDPVTRRQIWKLIEKLKADTQRCTVITTHSMEEADSLCNRIGIVCIGKLRAIGSQVHLKNKFGAGLKLGFVCNLAFDGDVQSPTALQDMKAIQQKYIEQLTIQVKSILCQDAFLEPIQSQLLNPSKKWNVSLTFSISRASKDEIAEIFSKVEDFCSQQHIQEWGFSQSSMEDVFIKVAQEAVVSPK
jgi:ABC-type multidrug transport system ATPase subunit